MRRLRGLVVVVAVVVAAAACTPEDDGPLTAPPENTSAPGPFADTPPPVPPDGP